MERKHKNIGTWCPNAERFFLRPAVELPHGVGVWTGCGRTSAWLFVEFFTLFPGQPVPDFLLITTISQN